MKVLIVAVGAVKGALAPVVADYERRASHHWKLSVEEVPAGTKSGSKDAQAVMSAEAERLLARVPAEVDVVALTRDGKSMDSRELAGYLDEHAVRSSPGVAFVIGGPDGLDDDLRRRADLILAFGDATWPHLLVRVMLAEQLYRAASILAGHPYHRGGPA